MDQPFYRAFVEVVPEARGLHQALDRTFDDAGRSGGRLAGAGMQTGVLGAVGKLGGPLVAAFAALGIGNIVADAVSTGFRAASEAVTVASSFTEASTAIDAVFGDGSEVLQDWASTAATAFGQSRLEALSAAKTFGVFGQAAGLAGQENVNFSTALTELASDLASFHDTTPEAAIQALGAGLRGESEPLRQFGILLDDAALKQRAMELGIYDGNGALTQQQRVLAANSAIFDQAGAAAGDFEKTSGGLANQQRTLAGALEDAQIAFGTALLPAVTELVQFANAELLPMLTDVIDEVGPVLGTALSESTPEILKVAESFAELLPPLVDLGIAVLPPLVDLLTLLTPLLVDWATSTATVWDTVGGLVDFLSGETTFDEFSADVMDGGGSMFELAKSVGTALGESILWFRQFGADVRTNVEGFLSVITGIPDRVLAALRGAGSWLVQLGRDMIAGLVSGAQSVLANLGKFFLEVVPEWIREPFKKALGIHSPSREFAEYGRNLGEGLMIGVGDIRPAVETRMTSLVNVPDVRANVDAAVSAASSASGDQPIYADTGELIGWIRRLANGEARLVWALKDDEDDATLRGGTIR